MSTRQWRQRRQRRRAAAKGGLDPEELLAAQVHKLVNVSMLLRLRDHMRQQLQDCIAAIQTDQISCIDHITDEQISQGATEDFERAMEELKLTFLNKTLALERVQLGFHLKNKANQDDSESRLIIGSMKNITMLSGRVIEYQQQAREKERKLNDIKRKRLSLKKSGEQKILQIYTMIKKIKVKQGHVKMSKMLETMHRNLQKERQRITLLQNVFQNILIGSRVNWAEDPSLKAIVLQLENNVCSM